MAGLFPVPTGRVSDLLSQRRLLSQLQSDQVNLLKLQEQIGTGRRILAPSEDAPAAVRGIDLQRLLEQKAQIKTNLTTSQSYLAATDTAIASVTDLLSQIRGLAVQAVDSTTGEIERQAASQDVEQAISQLLDIANKQFRGRYLFAGSSTETPFQSLGEFVKYLGNEDHFQSFADTDLLFDTNTNGNEVFGAISPEVRGTADLNPVLTENTRLSDLRGGAGISKGSIAVSDGATTRTIDISKASTIGDVARLIEQNPPTNRKVTARVTATGLVIDIDDALGGNLTVREVGGGTTAAQLGILETTGTGTSPIVGKDLNPKLRLTTRLSDILGVRATAVVTSAGANNDIFLEAKNRGPEYNGFTLQYVDDELLQASPGLSAGNETVSYSPTAVAARAAVTFSGLNNNLVLTANTAGVSLNNVQINIVSAGAVGNAATVNYDSVNKVLNIGVDSTGLTQVQTVINEIAAEGTFTAAYDASAPGDGGYLATAAINAADIGAVQGNTGNSGGEANTIFVNIQNTISTANDVVAALQNDAAVSSLFTVSIDDKDSSTTGFAGTAPVDVNGTGVTSGGSGVEFDQATGLQINNGGETYAISFQDAETVEDLLNILNGSAASVAASINADGTGIDIRSRLSGADFSIGENGGTTATELGVRTLTRDTTLDSLNHGLGVHTADGTDFIIQRNDGTQLAIDISTAETVGDVLDLINNHVDNQDPATQVLARLAPTGNGIQIVDDNPQGANELTLIRDYHSEAAWDLGLIPQGVEQIRASEGPSPAPATATVAFAPPDDLNTGIQLTAGAPGTDLNGIAVQFVNNTAVGDVALVAFDPVAKTLTIDVDPAATTAATVVNAITAEGTFTAVLDQTTDPTNDGSGLITQTGVQATTAGGTSNPSSLSASASVSFAAPNDVNTAMIFHAVDPGTAYNGVAIEFQDTLIGDVANATYDSVNKRLIVSIDATQTTANTIRAAVAAEGHFLADLDTSNDPTNDGSGIVGTAGVVGTTSGGTPEVITGSDVNPLETEGVFNTLLRLNKALNDFDLREIERVVGLLDEDFNRVAFTRASLGARQQGLDAIQYRLEDENVQLQGTLSKEIDVDFTEAVSNLTAQQAAYQASLQMIGQTYRLTLLDFL